MDPRTAQTDHQRLANGEVELSDDERPLTVDPELPNKLQHQA